MINALGEAAASGVSTQIHAIDGRDLCRVHVPPSASPWTRRSRSTRAGQMIKKTAFYVRIGNGTREISDAAERAKYVAARWGP